MIRTVETQQGQHIGAKRSGQTAETLDLFEGGIHTRLPAIINEPVNNAVNLTASPSRYQSNPTCHDLQVFKACRAE